MAQAQGGGGGVERLAMRTIALIVGLIGVVLALVINILYSLVHTIGRVAGLSNDTTHFFYGLLVVLIGAAGAFLAPLSPVVSAVMLAVAGIAFFFIVGPWALIASPFLLVAAVLTFTHRRESVPWMA